MGADGKAAPEDTGYYLYEVIGDNTYQTSIHNSFKTVCCRRVRVRGITLTVGVFFDGTGNNRSNSNDLKLAYTHCAGLVGEERAQACAKYEEHARADLGNGSWQGESQIFLGSMTYTNLTLSLMKIRWRRRSKPMSAASGRRMEKAIRCWVKRCEAALFSSLRGW